MDEVNTGVNPLGTLAKALPRWAVTDARPSRHGTTRGIPTGVILCARYLRDYRIHTGDGGEVFAEGTAVNVKAESLRLGDFLRNQAMRAARPTQRRDRVAFHHGSPADRVTPDPRSAVVGQCACPPSLLPSQTNTRQQPVDHRGRDSRRAGSGARRSRGVARELNRHRVGRVGVRLAGGPRQGLRIDMHTNTMGLD